MTRDTTLLIDSSSLFSKNIVKCSRRDRIQSQCDKSDKIWKKMNLRTTNMRTTNRTFIKLLLM